MIMSVHRKKKRHGFPSASQCRTSTVLPMLIMATYCSQDGGHLVGMHVSSYYLTVQRVKHNKKTTEVAKRVSGNYTPFFIRHFVYWEIMCTCVPTTWSEQPYPLFDFVEVPIIGEWKADLRQHFLRWCSGSISLWGVAPLCIRRWRPFACVCRRMIFLSLSICARHSSSVSFAHVFQWNWTPAETYQASLVSRRHHQVGMREGELTSVEKKRAP